MSGLVCSSQSNNRSCRLRSELMFQETILIGYRSVNAMRNRCGRRITFFYATIYSSISTPGVGTMISEFGKSDRNRARIHSTAGGSP